MRCSVIIPTFRRPDVLHRCLESLEKCSAGGPCFDVRVYDNGAPQDSRSVVDSFSDSLSIVYTLNEPGHGLGYSLNRGAVEATGDIVVELNDDALVPQGFILRIEEIFRQSPDIGVLGFRAIECGYESNDGPIGTIDGPSMSVVGNFDRPSEGLVDVEHVYGFCYAYRRDVLERGAWHDAVLLAKDYSSGNRIETDHCLAAKRLGYRVVYDGTMGVEHLAKPRGDIDERSSKWRVNHIRNTLYLYLKHFGCFGRGSIALRFGLLHDVGLISLLRRPNGKNAVYFFTGLKARVSAVGHWLYYLVRGPKLHRLPVSSTKQERNH